MPLEVVSPELALVCPDLREVAIAALPDRDPDAWLDQARLRPIRRPEYASTAAFSIDRPESGSARAESTPLPIAILAYSAASATRFAAEAAAFVAIVIGVLSIVAAIHP